jgi:type I restriction enzyme M protein
MSRNAKPKTPPATPFPAEGLHREGSWLWLPLRNEWRDVGNKPEEDVRQGFIRHLVEQLGYDLAQMDQERRTQHGHRRPPAC